MDCSDSNAKKMGRIPVLCDCPVTLSFRAQCERSQIPFMDTLKSTERNHN